MRFILALVVSVFFVFTANAQAPKILPQILPLSQATNGAPPKLVDIKSKSAGLTFISSIPLACTVVFGKSEQFGMIANDPDMSALTTINHNPVLGGLEPDTKYYFPAFRASQPKVNCMLAKRAALPLQRRLRVLLA